MVEELELSDRLCDVMKAIFDAETDASIGERLGIATNTVHSHVQRLHQRLGVWSRVGLVVRVVAEVRAREARGR